MSNFVIIVDTSSDMIRPLRERFKIDDYVSGVVYFPDGHSEFADLDWEKHDHKTFFESMKNKNVIFKTASVSTGDFINVFEKYLADGKDILSLSLSSGLSGTYQTSEMVAGDLMKKYPKRKILCIDSLRYASAIAMLAIEASKKRDEGMDVEKCAAHINAVKQKLHQMGPMDDLFFLCKTGRISNFKAFFGTLVGVNPMADFNRNGLSEVLGKFKGKKAAFDATIEYMKKTIENPSEQTIFISHSNRYAAAETLKEKIIKEFSPKEIIINEVGMSCGASIGPGLCTAFYWGKELSEDLVYEKSVMQEILENQK